jgi:hypothetical protein
MDAETRGPDAEPDGTAASQAPTESAAPAEPVDDQTPPPDYEPQVELSADQTGGIVERDGVTVDDAATEENNVGSEDLAKLGTAADGDDDAEDGEPEDS